MSLRAPFPWFGGKSRAARLVWDAFGDPPNFVEPFAGSLAVLLGRPTAPRIETVNDLDCVAPETRMLASDMSWRHAGELRIGDKLLGFDESNGPAREGLRAPTRYRRLAVSTVTGVRRIRKPSYRLTFSDGTTVVASANHLWLGGSHRSGGRGWRWVKTENMVCNRTTQRSWVLKVCDVVEREESFDAGWLGGMFDGEGHMHVGPALRAMMSQNDGPIRDRAESLLRQRGYDVTVVGKRRCKVLQVNGGTASALGLLMRFRPARLIAKLCERAHHVSLYGRSHRAIGLVKKEFLGEQTVMAIETDTRTFIAEGLASHNCYISNFWRAVAAEPEAVAAYADWPVNEADLHARHRWLVNQAEFRDRMKHDPEYCDAKVAGWWVWGICQWIGSGWCSAPEWQGRVNAGRAPRGIHSSEHNQRPDLTASRGILSTENPSEHERRPHLSDAGNGIGVHHKMPKIDRGTDSRMNPVSNDVILEWMFALAARLRRVRVCCGDWTRILGPSSTEKIGVTGVFLDPPYSGAADRDPSLYTHDSLDVAHAVRAWALEHGDNPKLRIALCGYEGEHEMPDTWRVVAWKANGGYASSAGNTENSKRERIWFSPHCLGETGQVELFPKEAP